MTTHKKIQQQLPFKPKPKMVNFCMSDGVSQLRGYQEENTTANTSRAENTPAKKHINSVLVNLGKHLVRFSEYETPQLQAWVDDVENA